MTDYESIARQRLYLVHDNPDLRRVPRDGFVDRLSYLLELAAVAAFVLGFWWGVAVLILSLER